MSNTKYLMLLIGFIVVMVIFVDNFPRHVHTIDNSSEPQRSNSVDDTAQNKPKDEEKKATPFIPALSAFIVFG